MNIQPILASKGHREEDFVLHINMGMEAVLFSQSAQSSEAWKAASPWKRQLCKAYVFSLRNMPEYYPSSCWRLTDRLIQFVYQGVKRLKKYFTSLYRDVSRFAEGWGREEVGGGGWMTFSLSGGLTSRLLAAIGLSRGINAGTDMYSIIVSPAIPWKTAGAMPVH